MRRSWVLGLVLAALFSIGIATVGSASEVKIKAGDLILTFGSTFSPKKLAKHDFTPFTANIFGKIETNDGTHPSAFRETVVDVDKDISVSVKGLPVCKASKLEATNTTTALKVCGATLLGEGSADAEIAFPEQLPIKVHSPLKVFNGGEKGGKVTLLIHTFITVPAPTAIVTTVTIQRKGSGLHSIAKVPQIAGGSGSAIDFSFKLGRTFTYKGKKKGYLEARCPDGAFKVNSPKTLFKNEAQVPNVAATTKLNGSLVIPCTPGA